MIYFDRHEVERPDDGDRKTPPPNQVKARQRPTVVRVTTGRRPEVAA